MGRADNICVGCQRLLIRGERYGVRRGRLWHSTCFQSFEGRTAADRDQEQALRRAEMQRTDAERRERENVSALETDRFVLRGRVASLETRLGWERTRADRHSSELATAQQTIERLERELAMHRALGQPRVPVAPAPAAAPDPVPDAAPVDDRDPISIRFSLLELD
jgi:hypothetical protein